MLAQITVKEIQNRIALKNRRLMSLLKARGNVDVKIEEMKERLSCTQSAYADEEILMVRHDLNTLVAAEKQFTRQIKELHEAKEILQKEWGKILEEDANG